MSTTDREFVEEELWKVADVARREGYQAARRDLLAALGNQSRRSFWGRQFKAGYAHAVKIVREYGKHE